MNAEEIRRTIKEAVEKIGCKLEKYDGRRFLAVVSCPDGRIRNIFAWKNIKMDHLKSAIDDLYV